MNGCDTLINVVVLSVSAKIANDTAKICKGDTYLFNGMELDSPGIYTDTVQTVTGCDSITILHLTVSDTSSSSFSVNICPGQFYSFAGLPLYSPGFYTYSFNNVNGCDSVVTLHLTVLDTSGTAIYDTICANEVYLFGNEPLNSPGDYVRVLTNINGCDSTIIYMLTVLSVSNPSIYAAICANEIYLFGNDTLDTTGDYRPGTNQHKNGCDSTVTLHLTVLPTYDLSIQRYHLCKRSLPVR